MTALNFDATNVPQNDVLEPVPAGWYQAQIIESEMKPTSNGQGSFLALTLQIVAGPFAGRKLFDRLNLQNNNQTAVEIAYKTLSSICHSTGVIQCADSQQLHGRPMDVKVALVPGRSVTDQNTGQVRNYEASNEIKGYKALGQGDTQNTSAATATTGYVPPFAGAPATVPAPPAPAYVPPAPPVVAPPAWQGTVVATPPAVGVPATTTGVPPWAGQPGVPVVAAPNMAPPPAVAAPAAVPATTGIPPWQQPK